MRIKVGDVITLRDRSKQNEYFKKIDEISPAGEENGISWLKVNRKKFEITMTGLPVREETEPDINEQLIVEYYSR
jgi:ribosomal protein S4